MTSEFSFLLVERLARDLRELVSHLPTGELGWDEMSVFVLRGQLCRVRSTGSDGALYISHGSAGTEKYRRLDGRGELSHFVNGVLTSRYTAPLEETEAAE